MNILHLTPDFNYADGRSYYVSLLLKYFKKSGNNVFLCTNAGDSFDRIADFDIPVFINPSLSAKTSFMKSLKYIDTITDANKIDIVHSHHRYYELLANSLNKKKVKTVFTALSIVDKRYFVEYKSDRIIAVSNTVKNMLVSKFNIKESDISLIPNFVDSEEIAYKTKNGYHKSQNKIRKLCILAIGRLHRDKSLETLLNAVALLKEYRIKILLIGAGDEKEKYENIIKKNSLDAELIPPQRYLSKYFDEADICVLTSIRDPLPGFLLQSGLYNKPFIGANTDGIAEVIVDRQNGLLFKAKNEIELSEKIRLFAEDDLFAKKCSDNLFRLISGKYTEKAVIPKIQKLYDSLFD